MKTYTAKKFESRIELVYRDRVVDCKSIMGVITLGAQKDNVLDLIIKGDDEQQALDAIVKLVNDKFGEDQERTLLCSCFIIFS